MKLQNLLVALFATFALVGCNDNNNPDDEKPVSGYTIVVDKDTLEANGSDVVTFSVLDAEGNDILEDENNLSKTYFVNAEDESRLPRTTRTFASVKNGTYTFYATVRGVKTTNSVTVTAVNRGAYEKYRQQICLFQITGTWCPNCPRMSEGLRELKKGYYGENAIIIAAHKDDEYSISCNGRDVANRLLGSSRYGSNGIPHVIIDLSFGSIQSQLSVLNSLMAQQLTVAPSTCGVKINKTSMDVDGNVTIEASVTAEKDGVFDLAYVIVADNMPGGSSSFESVYNNVIAAVSDNYIAMSNTTKVSLKANEEYTKTFTTKVEPFGGVAMDASDYRVIVYAHNTDHIDNANECKMGSMVDYILN